MEKKISKKAHQSDQASFKLLNKNSEDVAWAISHQDKDGYFRFSNNNNWETDFENQRTFASLHAAINYANRRGFRLTNVPEFICEIDDETNYLNIYLDGKPDMVIPHVKSQKQVADIMREYYAVNVNKTSSLI